jgi:hypothetical protein
MKPADKRVGLGTARIDDQQVDRELMVAKEFRRRTRVPRRDSFMPGAVERLP